MDSINSINKLDIKDLSDVAMVTSDTLKIVHFNHICGDHETQIYKGGEADLHKHFDDCTKHPGHIDFIPIEAFELNHLPEGHRDKDLFDVVKALADLTVRVAVETVSPNRPECWSGTKVPYPFYNMSGNGALRTGTGRIRRIYQFTDGHKHKSGGKQWGSDYVRCWCKKCQLSGTPSNVWWEFIVDTATHVVFDDTEARNTTLRLFYDRENSHEIIVDSILLDYASVEKDVCKIKCVTCDKNLAEVLNTKWEHFFDLWYKVHDKYETSRDALRLTIIVSHPHGCPKCVSIGQWVDKYPIAEVVKYEKFTYTTCTCPGSSGAPVHCVGYWYGELVHTGTLISGLNYSGAGQVLM